MSINKGQLVKKLFISGTITSLSGLHIGGSNMGLSIGGVDNAVIRNPKDNYPYIPGSSLKGKMRSLLERLEFKFGPGLGNNINAGPYLNLADTTTLIPRLFGVASDDETIEEPVSRIIVRDCELTAQSKEELNQMIASDMPFTEVKTEVVIDRITAKAMPRQIERVPAGSTFNLRLVLNIFDGDEDTKYMSKIFQALDLVQDDYLGGSGGRGSGEISIKVSEVRQKVRTDYEAGTNGTPYQEVSIPETLQ